MDFDQLVTFLEVAKLGSFSRAGQKVFRSQSAVSAQIRQLEQEYGDRLLDRSGKVEWDEKFQLVKVNPLADWTTRMVWDYVHKHNVLYNPLHDQNFPSIGCTHCTRAVQAGEDARAGRWAGSQKTECGLHIGDSQPAASQLVRID